MILELSATVALPKIRLSSAKNRCDIFGLFLQADMPFDFLFWTAWWSKADSPPHTSRISKAREGHLGEDPG